MRGPRTIGRQLGAACALGAALALSASACTSSEDTAAEPMVEPGPPEPFSALTFNVLCSFCGGGQYDAWTERLEYFGDIFARHDPDIIGLQELAVDPEIEQVLALVPGYHAVHYRNAESEKSYPDALLLIRQERFELRAHGSYWLSPTPDLPYSKGFSDSQVAPRLVVWAELLDRQSRQPLYVATTHFDNNSPCQELSAPVVLERTAPWSETMPVVVMGDFNAQPEDEAYQTLTQGADGYPPLENSQALAAEWRVQTNQSPAPDYRLEDRIDHIFVAPNGPAWTVDEWVVDLHVYGPDDRYPSDHRPMAALLTAPELAGSGDR